MLGGEIYNFFLKTTISKSISYDIKGISWYHEPIVQWEAFVKFTFLASKFRKYFQFWVWVHFYFPPYPPTPWQWYMLTFIDIRQFVKVYQFSKFQNSTKDCGKEKMYKLFSTILFFWDLAAKLSCPSFIFLFLFCGAQTA